MSNPDINRIRDLYSWTTSWRATVSPDAPHMAEVQATLREEFDIAVEAHVQEKVSEVLKEVLEALDKLEDKYLDTSLQLVEDKAYEDSIRYHQYAAGIHMSWARIRDILDAIL